MTDITQSRITGRIALPDNTSPVDGYIRFTLTGYDTESGTDAVVLGSFIDAGIDANGDIDVELFPTTSGVRSRYYSVTAYELGEIDDRPHPLGSIQVGDIGPYDLNDLLPVGAIPGLTPDRALAVEQKAADNEADIAALSSSLATLTGNVDDNDTDIATNANAIASLSANLTSLSEDVTDNETEVLENQTAIADLVDEVSTRQRHFTLTLGGGATADDLTGTTGQSITEYRNGDAFTINPASDNTGAMTFEADGLGNLTFNARENTPMAAGMVKTSERITVRLESVGETFRAILMDLSKAEFNRINLIEANADENAGRVADIEQTVSDYSVLAPSEGITTGGFVSVDTGAVVSSASFKYAYYTVEQNRVYKLSGQPNGGTTALATWIDADGDVISTNFPGESGGASATIYIDEEITSPAGAVKLGMSQNINRDAAFEAKGPTVSPNIAARVASVEALPFAGKTATVFGTSIWTGTGAENSLAQLLGTATGLTINQQTTASLIFRAGFVADVDVAGGDPYGWFGKRATQITRSLMQTTAQKQFLIDNWATFFANFGTTGSYSSTLTPEEEAEILAYSYEQRLVTDSLGVNATDYYIFGDCYNDQADGDDIATATGEIGSTGVYEDTNTYIGSMNLMMRLILESNPSAKFIMAGHFENQRIPSIAAAQTIVANDWSIPLIKTWEDLGWSQKLIEWNGDWNADTVSSYSFVPGASNIDTVLKRNVPGGVHPYFDSTGAANAAIIAAIKSNMTRLAP